MSKKKGLSLEEKRKAILGIFHETEDVFQLKDIEKLGPKKGVIQLSIKEVVQSLVDDDLVHQDKIGSGNYFWSFPSETAVKLEANLSKLEAQLQENEQTSASLENEIREQTDGKEDTAERQAKVQQKRKLEAVLAQQDGELAQYADNDPERYNYIKEGMLIAQQSANRWLDNIEMLKKWMKKRFEGQDQQLDFFFSENGYKEDMDYL